ncbi:MAG: SDR family oxidoreductase [Phaeodactylibacter sp.]|nr:SDR family oxidoreductase [Phaeodactylibacter sp.]MCB9053083.1 SDR family oxidoreductase [Lewinellaceae bacterium]
MKTILITGATGTTGSATLQQLQGKGLALRVMTRSAEKAAAFEKQGISAVVADYSDPASLARALDGVERAFLVHSPSLEIPKHEKAFIDAAKKAGVKKIVALSVIGAGPDSPLRLSRMHAEVEAHLKNSGMAYTILRPHSFLQNLLGNIPTIQGQGAMYSNNGEAKIPLIDARDIGAVAAAALTEEGHDGKAYTLTGPAAVSFQEVAGAIGKAIGREVHFVNVPDDAAKQGLMGAGFPEWLADDLVTLNQWGRQVGEQQPSEDVQKVLGRPGHSLEDFARDYAGAFKG